MPIDSMHFKILRLRAESNFKVIACQTFKIGRGFMLFRVRASVLPLLLIFKNVSPHFIFRKKTHQLTRSYQEDLVFLRSEETIHVERFDNDIIKDATIKMMMVLDFSYMYDIHTYNSFVM